VIPMEKEIYIRFVRRVCTVVFVLVLLLFFNAQVLAEGPVQNADPVTDAAEAVLSADRAEPDFTAVAAQLEAVARDHGRKMADQMLYGSFEAVSEVYAGAGALPASGSVQVIAVEPAETGTAFLVWLPYLLAFLALVGGGCILLCRRRMQRNRRVVYKPMRTPAVHNSPYFVYRVQHTYR